MGIIHLIQRLLIGGLLTFVPGSTMASLVRPVSVADSSSNISAGDSVTPIMTPDGRYILFASTAENLVFTTNGSPLQTSFPARFNVFLRDRTNETTTLVSVNLNGTGGGNGDSMPMGISTNGRFALFETTATNLVANDANNASDVFMRDLVNKTNILVSVKTNGGVGNGNSRSAVMTPDGRFVAFVSEATNLIFGDTNLIADVFVRDLQLGTTVLASVGARATNSYASSSESPEISGDGRYVAFYSTATNLIPGVARSGEIYVRDLVSNTTLFASTNAHSATRNTNTFSFNHALSADGKFVAYTASRITPLNSSNLVLRHNLETGLTDLVHTNAHLFLGPREDARTLDMAPDGRFIVFLANTKIHTGSSFTTPSVWVWDAETGLATLASVNVTNGLALGSFEWPVIDSTGRFICFTSTATNLTTNSLFGSHVYVRDMLLNETSLVSVDNDGVSAFAVPCLSADGKLVVFQSSSAPGSTENSSGKSDLYLRDLQTNTTELISVAHPGLPSFSPNGPSALSSLSVNANGRYVAFTSLASNLVTNDTNANRDVFIRDLLHENNILVSIGMNGFSAAGMSFEPSISGDGRFIAFTSTATNLIPGDLNNKQDVFVFDSQNQSISLGSARTNGAVGNSSSSSPVISSDGRYLLFRSKASNLAAGSFNWVDNLFFRDLQTSNTVALTTRGIVDAAMTPDGRFVAFVGGIQSGSVSNLYVWDSSLGTRIFTNSLGDFTGAVISPEGNRLAYVRLNVLYGVDRVANTSWTIGALTSFLRAGPKFSGDGKFLTYASRNVFIHDFQSKTNTLVSRNSAMFSPVPANAKSDFPDISYDGRFVAYRSEATNIAPIGLLPTDTNGWPDVFLYDRFAGTNRLIGINQSGKPGNNRSHPPVSVAMDGHSYLPVGHQI